MKTDYFCPHVQYVLGDFAVLFGGTKRVLVWIAACRLVCGATLRTGAAGERKTAQYLRKICGLTGSKNIGFFNDLDFRLWRFGCFLGSFRTAAILGCLNTICFFFSKKKWKLHCGGNTLHRHHICR